MSTKGLAVATIASMLSLSVLAVSFMSGFLLQMVYIYVCCTVLGAMLFINEIEHE